MTTGQTVHINIAASDNGTLNKVNNEAKKVHQTVDSLNSKMGSLGSGGARPASQTAAARAANPTGGVVDPGLGRGTAGGGGRGDSRDFARQAQGLGGLVHVYATFAANLFAVSAAFNALSKAADVTNMVEGLNQLGAASGKNLGSMAKNLTKLADGAISLKEAMAATAQASAAGLSGEQLERMTKVAKTASQALGRDMGDALNRLSRGITKIEPELLDELGIMVKVDKASRDYALTLGKTATQLTDFEKRQAFANAVIEQGEKKFGKINIDANPYQKLLATFTNLTIAGGELINKVLGPIAKLLGESPAALATVMAGIAGMLLSKAIPALGQWREGLVNTAKVAADKAKNIRDEFEAFKHQKAFGAGWALQKQFTELENQASSTFDKVRSKSLQVLKSGELADTFRSGATQTSARMLELLEKQAGVEASKLAKMEQQAAASRTLTNEESALLEKQKLRNKLLQDAVILAREEIAVRQQAAGVRLQSEDLLDRGEASVSRDPGYLDEEAQKQRIADRADRVANRAQILANVGANTQTMGMSEAWKKLKTDIAATTSQGAAGITGLNKATTLLSGGIRILASAAATLISSLMNMFMYVGFLVMGFQLLNSWLSNNSKESEAFSSASEKLNESLEGSARTLDYISKLSPLEQVSPDSLKARANSFNEIATSVSSLSQAFDKVKAASTGVWDSAMNSISKMWGGSFEQKFKSNLSKTISSGLSILTSGPLKAETEKKLRDALGMGEAIPLNLDNVQKALDKLDPSQLSNTGKTIEGIFKEANREANNSAAAISTFHESLKQNAKEIEQTLISFKPSDSMSKIYMGYTKSLQDFEAATRNSVESLSVLADMVGDLDKLKALPEAMGEALLDQKTSIEKVGEEYAKAVANTSKYQKELDEVTAKYNAKKFGDDEFYQLKQQKKLLEHAVSQNKFEAEEALKKVEEIRNTVREGIVESFRDAAKYLDKALDTAKTKAASILAGAQLSGIKSEKSVDIDTSFKIKELNAQLDLIDSQSALIVSQERLRIAFELRSAEAAKEKASGNKESLDYKNADAALEGLKTQDRLFKEIFGTAGKGKLGSTEVAARLKIDEKNDTIDIKAAKAGLLNILAAFNKVTGERQIIKSQQSAAVIGGELEKSGIRAGKTISSIEDQQKLNAVYAQNLDLEIRSSKVFNQTLYDKKQALLVAQDAQEVQKIMARQQQAEEDYATRVAGTRGTIKKAIEEEYDATTKKYNLEIKLQNIKSTNAYDALKAEAAEDKLNKDKQSYENEKKIADFQRQVQEDTIQGKLTEIRLQKEAGGLTELEATKQENLLNLALDRLHAEEQLKNLKASQGFASRELDNAEASRKVSAVQSVMVDPNINDADRPTKVAEAVANITKEYEGLRRTQSQVFAEEANALNSSIALKLNTALATNAIAEAQAAHNDKMRELQSLTESLTVVFGDLGSAIGNFAQVFETATKNQLDKQKALDKAKKKELDLAEGNEEEIAKIDEKYQKKSAKLEIETNVQKISSAKKMFKEKTTAYKVLDAMEKANHAVKMGLMMVELATELGMLPAKLAAKGVEGAADMSLLPVKGAKAILDAMSNAPFPLQVVFGAAMAAMVASIIGGVGGQAPSANIKGGVTAEDRQSTQGTGMSWVKGKKVENGRGVFGDAEAKSESLTKIAEILEDNQIEGLYYDKNILDTLRSINKGIGGLAAKLVTVRGLRSGAITNARPDKILDSGISIAGQGTTVGKNSQLNNAPLSIADILAGNAQIRQYEYATRSGSNNNLVMKDTGIGSAVGQMLKGIFNNALNLLTQVGSSIKGLKNESGQEVQGADLTTLITDTFMKHDVTGALSQISLRGLTGTEMQEELSAVFGAEVDNIASEIFGGALDSYRKFGEGMLETVVRVVDGNTKVTTALEYMGVALPKVDSGLRGVKDVSFETSEALIEAAGGLDKFTEQATFFADHFLTEEQRMARRQTALNTGFQSMVSSGLLAQSAIPRTREQFAALVQGIDLSTTKGKLLYQALMDIAPAFDAVTSATEDAMNEIADSVADMLARIAAMKESFTLDTLDTPEKYNYYHRQDVALTDEINSAEFEGSGWQHQVRQMNKLLDVTEKQWQLLDADQKKALLPKYLEKLEGIETRSIELGLAALAEVSPDGLAITDAIIASGAAIIAAVMESGGDTNAALALIAAASGPNSSTFAIIAANTGSGAASSADTAANTGAMSQSGETTAANTGSTASNTGATADNTGDTADNTADNTLNSNNLATIYAALNDAVTGLKAEVSNLSTATTGLGDAARDLAYNASQPVQIQVNITAPTGIGAEVNGGGA